MLWNTKQFYIRFLPFLPREFAVNDISFLFTLHSRNSRSKWNPVHIDVENVLDLLEVNSCKTRSQHVAISSSSVGCSALLALWTSLGACNLSVLSPSNIWICSNESAKLNCWHLSYVCNLVLTGWKWPPKWRVTQLKHHRLFEENM